MIDRTSSYHSDPHSPPVRQIHQDDRARKAVYSGGKERRETLPLSNGRKDRSPSPYQRTARSDGRERNRSPSPKRRRRRSPSSSPDGRRQNHKDSHKPPRRRTSQSQSPQRRRDDHEKVAKRKRESSRSPRRQYICSPDSHERSKRRSSHAHSPPGHRHRSRDRSNRSKPRIKRSLSPSSLPPKRSKAPLPSQQDAFTGDNTVENLDVPPPVEKQKPNLAPTGALAKETNTAVGTSIVLKYNEPPESRLPPASAQWRMYVFKGDQELEKLELYTRSCWLFGRERAVVDMPIEHPSCSKQHAVIQFRYTEKRGEFGDRKGGVKPYIIDLDSANGTMLNGEKVDGRRYMELRTGDVLKFGESTREYVLLLPPKT